MAKYEAISLCVSSGALSAAIYAACTARRAYVVQTATPEVDIHLVGLADENHAAGVYVVNSGPGVARLTALEVKVGKQHYNGEVSREIRAKMCAGINISYGAATTKLTADENDAENHDALAPGARIGVFVLPPVQLARSHYPDLTESDRNASAEALENAWSNGLISVSLNVASPFRPKRVRSISHPSRGNSG